MGLGKLTDEQRKILLEQKYPVHKKTYENNFISTERLDNALYLLETISKNKSPDYEDIAGLFEEKPIIKEQNIIDDVVFEINDFKEAPLTTPAAPLIDAVTTSLDEPSVYRRANTIIKNAIGSAIPQLTDESVLERVVKLYDETTSSKGSVFVDFFKKLNVSSDSLDSDVLLRMVDSFEAHAMYAAEIYNETKEISELTPKGLMSARVKKMLYGDDKRLSFMTFSSYTIRIHDKKAEAAYAKKHGGKQTSIYKKDKHGTFITRTNKGSFFTMKRKKEHALNESVFEFNKQLQANYSKESFSNLISVGNRLLHYENKNKKIA